MRAFVLPAAAFAALAFFGVAGHSYWQARHHPDASYAATRDAALTAGRQDITRLSGIDPAHLDADLAGWLDATTGALHDELRRDTAHNRAVLGSSGITVRATVTDAALTALDTRAGTARLIATLQVDSTSKSGGPAGADRKRVEGGLARTPEGWKLTELTAVAGGSG